MQATNVEQSNIGSDISAEFNLSNGKTLTVYVEWHHNDGESWTFGVDLNLKDRQDYSYQTNNFDRRELIDAIEYLETSITSEEIDVVIKFIDDKKEKSAPDFSAHDGYYGV